MATTSYFDLPRAPSGPSMAVTTRWIDEQRESSPPIRSAFSATGLPTVVYDRSVSPNSLRCDEEVTRISASVASPPRPRTSSAPDSPSRCDVNVPIGGPQHCLPPTGFQRLASRLVSCVVACTVPCTVTDVRSRCSGPTQPLSRPSARRLTASRTAAQSGSCPSRTPVESGSCRA